MPAGGSKLKKVIDKIGDWCGPGAKSLESYQKHIEKLESAMSEATRLRQELNRLKGPKRKQPMEQLIREKEKEIIGHIKEINQKWPNAPKR